MNLADAQNDVDALHQRPRAMSGLIGSCCEEQEAQEAAAHAKYRKAVRASESRLLARSNLAARLQRSLRCPHGDGCREPSPSVRSLRARQTAKPRISIDPTSASRAARTGSAPAEGGARAATAALRTEQPLLLLSPTL